MDTHCEEMTTALPNKLCSENHKATEEDGDQGIPGEEIWIESEMGAAGFKYSFGGGGWTQNWKEKSGLLSAYAPLEATRHK